MSTKKPINRYDELTERMSDRLVAVADRLPEETVPYGHVKLDTKEQIVRYLEMRDDPQAWIQEIAERGIVGAIKHAQAMEVLVDANANKGEPMGESTQQPGGQPPGPGLRP